MGYERIKIEHAGAKNGGGAWMSLSEAKMASRCKRRQADRRVVADASPPSSGRWQRGKTVAAIYLADEEATAWAEWYRVVSVACGDGGGAGVGGAGGVSSSRAGRVDHRGWASHAIA